MWQAILKALGFAVKHKDEIEAGVELGVKVVHEIKEKKKENK
jgi:hypothetical protein